MLQHFLKWSESQRLRAEILFREYPFLKRSYDVSMELAQLYNCIRITKDESVNKKNIRGIAH